MNRERLLLDGNQKSLAQVIQKVLIASAATKYLMSFHEIGGMKKDRVARAGALFHDRK